MTTPTATPRPLPITLRTANLPTLIGFKPTPLSRLMATILPSVPETTAERRQTLSNAMHMANRVQQQVRTNVGLHVRHAALMLRHGRAEAQHIAELALASNISLILAEQGLGEELIPEIQQAQDAVAVLMQHFNDHGRARPTGQMLTVIDNLVDVVEAQLDSPDCTGLMVERARLEFRRRVDAGEVINVKKTA